jgi:MoaA/NifB/PqqE/SkfB family radical SAM enzyme
MLTGSEPLCAPGLGIALEALARNRLAWGMVSNGWSLDEAALRSLTAHGLQSLTLSLDGLREEHDWLRGRSGSFDRVVSAIEVVVRAQLPFFDVVTCVNPRNLDQLPAMRALLCKLGVPAWRLFAIFPRGRARTNAKLGLSDSDLAQHLVAADHVVQLAALGAPVTTSSRASEAATWSRSTMRSPSTTLHVGVDQLARPAQRLNE